MIDRVIITVKPIKDMKGIVINPKYETYLLVHDIPVLQNSVFIKPV